MSGSGWIRWTAKHEDAVGGPRRKPEMPDDAKALEAGNVAFDASREPNKPLFLECSSEHQQRVVAFARAYHAAASLGAPPQTAPAPREFPCYCGHVRDDHDELGVCELCECDGFANHRLRGAPGTAEPSEDELLGVNIGRLIGAKVAAAISAWHRRAAPGETGATWTWKDARELALRVLHEAERRRAEAAQEEARRDEAISGSLPRETVEKIAWATIQEFTSRKQGTQEQAVERVVAALGGEA